MSFFKKSKAKEFFKSLKNETARVLPKEDLPVVIKEAVLLPTICKGCHTIYQAMSRHVRGNPFNREDRVTECPLCHYLNEVEFDELHGGS